MRPPGGSRGSLFKHPGAQQVPGVHDSISKLGEILQAMHGQNMEAHNKSHQIATAPRVVHRTPDGKVAAIAPQLPNQGQ
jgi:hypothetical protein